MVHLGFFFFVFYLDMKMAFLESSMTVAHEAHMDASLSITKSSLSNSS